MRQQPAARPFQHPAAAKKQKADPDQARGTAQLVHDAGEIERQYGDRQAGYTQVHPLGARIADAPRRQARRADRTPAVHRNGGVRSTAGHGQHQGPRNRRPIPIKLAERPSVSWRLGVGTDAPPAVDAYVKGGFMKPVYRGIAVTVLQCLIVLSVAGKYALDRERLPRVWAMAAPFDPYLPVRGRYVSLHLQVEAAPAVAAQPGSARLSAVGGRLVATIGVKIRHCILL